MKALVANHGRAGSLFCTYQQSPTPGRRPSAAPLRLSQPSAPWLTITQQSSAPTHSTTDLEAMEMSMKASKQQGNGFGLPQEFKKKTVDLHDQFMKIQAEVSAYRALTTENETLKKENDELKAKLQEKEKLEASENEELKAKLMEKEQLEATLLQKLDVAQQEAAARVQQQLQQLEAELEAQKAAVQCEVEAAKLAATTPLQEQVNELEAKAAAQQEAAVRQVEAARLEAAAPLQQQLEELEAKLVAQREEAERAVEAAKIEVAGPLQQQLQEMGMQLQNSQAQLDRLGEAVEAAVAEKIATVQAVEAQKEELLLAMAAATRRLADVVYPPGTLPAGLSVSTRLDGEVDLDAIAAARQAQAQAQAQAAVAAAQAAAPGPAEPSAPVPAREPAAPPQQAARRVGGFFAWFLSFVGFWTYQLVGALMLYYAGAILRGAPPSLNLEFWLGSLVVCTLLSWANRMLNMPSFSG